MSAEQPEPTVRDPRSLRALAHPTRWAIIEALLGETTATATRISELIDEPVNSCSFHLRLLAKYGYIERAPASDGRAHPWRLIEQRVEWHAAGTNDTAADALDAMLIEREAARQRSFLLAKDTLEPEWQRAALGTGAYRWLTPAELGELNTEIEAILDRHRDRTDPSRRPADARLVRLLAINLPVID